jgi:hypothetical protein
VAELCKVPEKLFLKNIIGAPSATIYRNKLGIEYDCKLQWLVDLDFYIRILSNNPHLIYTPELLIITATNAAHQVTEICKNNAVIDMFEHLYLYHKIVKKVSDHPSTQYVWFRLFERYQIYSQVDLKHLGIELPSDILSLFFTAYHQAWLKRTPYRIYVRLPEPLKRVIRFIFIRKNPF